MSCPRCDAPTVAFAIPDDLRDQLPDDRPGAALCTRCLSVTPLDDPPTASPDFARVSDAFPVNDEAAVALACLLALLDSLVLYRAEIDAVAAYAETRGTDVLRTLERLAADDGVEPFLDLDRRARQLEQLI
ncbi:DUF6276 family protein [Halarchaeum nitratireducens]|uniref:Small CPxCG-related zinc finger protein n=1 Tax=Halarchaeum nitratireducens TaxID=489913 RepID=A0A830G9V0_9EURY|nr:MULTISPECIES: DUF6276 family protein [Halarchaeum]MBP2250298.1 hypothetical protein [Halarchaeum solikamskense]GGN12589.1 hypothetical protein GCM10009021_10800 [Halarchaeum nitratireducens]